MQSKIVNRIAMVLLLVLMLAITACETSKQVNSPQEMVGTWVGLGKNMMSNDFLDQREIPVMLIISEKGTLKGYIGDAQIGSAFLEKAPIWSKLLGNEIYRSTFDLSGYIINRESFRRDGGTLLFQKISNDEIVCAFNSTGSKVSSDKLILPVKDITLSRAR
jgi:hypothetical protein